MNIFNLAHKGIQQIQPYAPGKPLEELQREYGITDAIKLASNENPLGSAPKALAALNDAVGSLNRYPDGAGFALKQKIAQKFGVEYGQICLGNGSNEILEFAVRTFVNADENVLFSEHSFAVYALASLAVNAQLNIVKALPKDHPSAPYGHDLPAMLAAINPKTRVIFVANPNNPTGSYLSQDALYDFLRQVPKNVIVVLDQAYYEFVDKPDFADAKMWIDEFDNVLVAYTFSKLYGLPGLRIGYSLSSAKLVNLFDRVRQPFNTNSLAQIAAIGALDDGEFVQQTLDNNQRNMQAIVDFCQDAGLAYLPSVGNFMCVDVSHQGGKATGKTGLDVYDALLYHGVIVRPVASYAMPDFIRVTIGTDDETARFLTALKAVLASCP